MHLVVGGGDPGAFPVARLVESLFVVEDRAQDLAAYDGRAALRDGRVTLAGFFAIHGLHCHLGNRMDFVVVAEDGVVFGDGIARYVVEPGLDRGVDPLDHSGFVELLGGGGADGETDREENGCNLLGLGG